MLRDRTGLAQEPGVLDAIEAVRAARTFALGPVGIAAKVLPETAAYEHLRAAHLWGSLLQDALPGATPAGRVYLARLVEEKLRQGDVVYAVLAEDDSPLPTATGCTISTTTVAAYARDRRGVAAGLDRVDRGVVDEAARAPGFGRVLAHLRGVAGMSPAEVAAAAGVAEADVARWEAGRPPLPDPATVAALENALRERVFFGLGLLELATRRLLALGQDLLSIHPALVNLACRPVQRLFDLAADAGVALGGTSSLWPTERTYALSRPLRVDPPPPPLEYRLVEDRHYWHSEYYCAEHDEVVTCAFESRP